MASTGNRDNAYWLQRFVKDGRADLLERIETGEITVYKARQLAGYLKTGPKSPAAILSYHWQRASALERKRFVKKHLREVARVGREALAEIRLAEAQKPRATDQK